MTIPAPATLRITHGRESRAKASVVRIRVFQLLTEETRVPSDIVIDMYHIHFLHALIIYVYDHVIVCERRYVWFI